jgi:hypothetical protein
VKSSTIADAILRDRERRKSAAPRRKTALVPSDNPFAGWRMGPVGWFITCRSCAREFESRGWVYCPSCMELPAESRRREFDSRGLSDTGRRTRSHVAPSYGLSTLENAHKTGVPIGPRDFPIIVGGRRLPQEKPNPLGRVRVRPWL